MSTNPCTSNDVDWLEMDTEKISDTHLVDILTQLEKENSSTVANVQENHQVQLPGPSSQTNTINANSVSNIQKTLLVLGMYFPNSKVTINYNITNVSK